MHSRFPSLLHNSLAGLGDLPGGVTLIFISELSISPFFCCYFFFGVFGVMATTFSTLLSKQVIEVPRYVLWDPLRIRPAPPWPHCVATTLTFHDNHESYSTSTGSSFICLWFHWVRSTVWIRRLWLQVQWYLNMFLSRSISLPGFRISKAAGMGSMYSTSGWLGVIVKKGQFYSIPWFQDPSSLAHGDTGVYIGSRFSECPVSWRSALQPHKVLFLSSDFIWDFIRPFSSHVYKLTASWWLCTWIQCACHDWYYSSSSSSSLIGFFKRGNAMCKTTSTVQVPIWKVMLPKVLQPGKKYGRVGTLGKNKSSFSRVEDVWCNWLADKGQMVFPCNGVIERAQGKFLVLLGLGIQQWQSRSVF